MNEEPKINVEKQIAHWRDSAIENWKDVIHNLKGGRIAFAMFAAHLVIEKALKAHVVKTTKKLPPMIHNLVSLAKLADLRLTAKQMDVLADLNPMNILTRYPGETGNIPSRGEADLLVKRAKEVFEWLIEKL
jgi:HEPN domain-containing protein